MNFAIWQRRISTPGFSRYTVQMSLSIIYKVCCYTIPKFVGVQAVLNIKSGQLMNVFTTWPDFTSGSDSTEPIETAIQRQTRCFLNPLPTQGSHPWAYPDASRHTLSPLLFPPLCSPFPNLPELDWGRWLRHQKKCLTVDQNSGLTGESLIPHRLPLHPHSRRFTIPSSSPAPLH